MHSNIHIPIPFGKLTAPVEVLNIDRRACRTLRRASLYTVAEVLLRGKPKLSSIKHMGPVTADRIWAAAAGYLELRENQLVGEAASPAGSSCDVWEAPLGALPLGISTLQALALMGISRVDQLVRARANGYRNLLSLGARELFEIDQELRCYLAQAAQAYLQRIAGSAAILEYTAPSPGVRPALLLQLPGLPEHAWSILERRAIHCLPPSATGASSGRVWEIIRLAREQLQGNLSALSLFLDHFEEKSSLLQSGLGTGTLNLTTLVHYLSTSSAGPDIAVDEAEVERLIVLLRTLAMHPDSWFWKEMEPRWPRLIRLSCLVEPVLEEHEQVRQIAGERASAWKRKTYKELAYSVLARAGSPMHWFDIAEQARHFDGRRSFSLRTLQNTLSVHKELFVRVELGTYALAEWDSRPVETYSAIIASVLRQENRPMPLDRIFAKMSLIRPVKRSSLRMILCFDPQFYRSPQNTFGLRSWLA